MLKTYECMFIFLHHLNDQTLEEQLNKAASEITSLNGTVINTTRMGRNSFARPMKKQESGIFALITFTLDPKQIGVLQKSYRLNNNILRVQIVLAKKIPEKTLEPAVETPKA